MKNFLLVGAIVSVISESNATVQAALSETRVAAILAPIPALIIAQLPGTLIETIAATDVSLVSSAGAMCRHASGATNDSLTATPTILQWITLITSIRPNST